jgi:peroxiredoxin
MYIRFLTVIVIVVISMLMRGCKKAPENNVTISGTIENIPGKQLFFYQVLPSSQPLIDSASTDATGNFTIELAVEKAGFYVLRLNAGKEVTFVIEPGEKITLKANFDSIQRAYFIQGSPNSELYAQYHRFTSENLVKVDSLSALFAESRNTTDYQSVKNKLDEAYIDIFNRQKAKVVSFVGSHLNSLASLLIISNNFGPNLLVTEKTNPDLFLKLDSALFQGYQENSLVNAFHLKILSLKNELALTAINDSLLAPGKQAPEITLPNASGKAIKLSSLKGKLTLVYFWSGWNALSRQNNINLTSVYTKYHNRGFDIYAVSVDTDTQLWQKACAIDKAYWINVIDVKGPGSEFSKAYGVKSLPSMILVDKDGNIIIRQPEFLELEGLIKKNL